MSVKMAVDSVELAAILCVRFEWATARRRGWVILSLVASKLRMVHRGMAGHMNGPPAEMVLFAQKWLPAWVLT